jgi:hypothetical protein
MTYLGAIINEYDCTNTKGVEHGVMLMAENNETSSPEYRNSVQYPLIGAMAPINSPFIIFNAKQIVVKISKGSPHEIYINLRQI